MALEKDNWEALEKDNYLLIKECHEKWTHAFLERFFKIMCAEFF